MTRTRNNLVPFSRTPDYWVMRAGKRKSNAERSAAQYLYRQAFEQSHQADIAVKMAENYFHMGCYTAARRICVDLLAKSRSNAMAYYWLARTALAEKDEELGEQALALALKKGWDLPIADEIQDLLSDYPWTEPYTSRRSQRAWCLYDKALRELASSRTEEAENFLQRSVRRGNCPEAEALLGELLFCKKKYTESIRHLRRAADSLNDHPSVWVLLAQANWAVGNNDDATRALSNAIEHVCTSREWGITAAASFYMNCPEVVVEALKQALRDAPESNDLLYVLAAIDANSGRFNDAIRCLNAILNRDPDDRDAKAALCILGYGPVPFYRIPDDAQLVDELCSEHYPEGDLALRRLVHGLTISMGGALTYTEVRGITTKLWDSLNPLQRHLCDRRSEWPNAFYRMLSARYRVYDLPETAALWPLDRHKRRVRRMSKYLMKTLTKTEVDPHG